MITQFLSAAAAISLLGAGIVSSAETRSFQAMTPLAGVAGASEGLSANMCRVDVVRTGAAGSADITRQNLGDGSCVCTVVTGPAGANGSAEATVDALLRDRSCQTDAASIQMSTQAASGGNGGVIVGIGFALGAVAIGAFAGSDS